MPESKVDSNGTSSMLRRLNIGGGSASSASSSTTVRGPPLTMEDLSNRDVITPNDVKRLNAITDGTLFHFSMFNCPGTKFVAIILVLW